MFLKIKNMMFFKKQSGLLKIENSQKFREERFLKNNVNCQKTKTFVCVCVCVCLKYYTKHFSCFQKQNILNIFQKTFVFCKSLRVS